MLHASLSSYMEIPTNMYIVPAFFFGSAMSLLGSFPYVADVLALNWEAFAGKDTKTTYKVSTFFVFYSSFTRTLSSIC